MSRSGMHETDGRLLTNADRSGKSIGSIIFPFDDNERCVVGDPGTKRRASGIWRTMQAPSRTGVPDSLQNYSKHRRRRRHSPGFMDEGLYPYKKL